MIHKTIKIDNVGLAHILKLVYEAGQADRRIARLVWIEPKTGTDDPEGRNAIQYDDSPRSATDDPQSLIFLEVA